MCKQYTGHELLFGRMSCHYERETGGFECYTKEEPLDLVGIINCSGCPTVAGYEKLIERVRALTEFNVDAIHLTYCVDMLCPFKARYIAAIKEEYPNLKIVMGTHAAKVTPDQYRAKVNKLLCQPRKSMVDIIKGRVK